METNKYYWLKMKKDFFKRHDIIILEALPNGREYAYFYMKLMLESIDHNGQLRFSEELPYTMEMLSAITRTNIDVVKNAIECLERLGMLTVMEDNTYFLPKVTEMLGSTSESDSAERVRRFRERKKQEQITQSVTKALQCNVTNVTFGNESIDIEKDIDIDIKENNTKVLQKKKLSFGNYNRIKLTQEQYDKLVVDYGKDVVDTKIIQLDEYVESNDNKNKYKDFNLVLRRAIRENWFEKEVKTKSTKERVNTDWVEDSKKRILEQLEE